MTQRPRNVAHETELFYLTRARRNLINVRNKISENLSVFKYFRSLSSNHMSRHLRPALRWQKRLTTDENQSHSYLLPCSPDRSLLPLLISEVKERSLDSSFIITISAQLTVFTSYRAGRVSVLFHFLRSRTSWSCRWTVYCVIPQLAV